MIRPIALALLGLFLASVLALTPIPVLAQQSAQASSNPPTGIACAYNTSPPTITTGFAGWLQCDSAGRLLLSPGSSSTPTIVSDTQSAPFAGIVAMTVGVPQTALRSVGVLATIAGNVTFEFSDTSTLTLPVYVGWQTFPFACIEIVSAGTTATATYSNLK